MIEVLASYSDEFLQTHLEVFIALSEYEARFRALRDILDEFLKTGEVSRHGEYFEDLSSYLDLCAEAPDKDADYFIHIYESM